MISKYAKQLEKLVDELESKNASLQAELDKTLSLLGKERDEWRKLETELAAELKKVKDEIEHLSCPHCGSDVDGKNWKSVAGKYRVALEKMPHEFYCFRLSPIKGGENSECNCLKAALRDDGEETKKDWVDGPAYDAWKNGADWE